MVQKDSKLQGQILQKKKKMQLGKQRMKEWDINNCILETCEQHVELRKEDSFIKDLQKELHCCHLTKSPTV